MSIAAKPLVAWWTPNRRVIETMKILAVSLIAIACSCLAVAQEKKRCSIETLLSCTDKERERLLADIERKAAEAERQEPCYLEAKYDRFKDETLDSCMYAIRSYLYVPDDDVSLHVMAQYPGKAPGAGKVRFYFALRRFYLKPFPSTTFAFGDSSSLFLIIDDNRISLPITEYVPERLSDEITEKAVANIDPKTLLALTSAHSIEVRWGRKEMLMSSTAIERMQQFIRKHTSNTISQ